MSRIFFRFAVLLSKKKKVLRKKHMKRTNERLSASWHLYQTYKLMKVLIHTSQSIVKQLRIHTSNTLTYKQTHTQTNHTRQSVIVKEEANETKRKITCLYDWLAVAFPSTGLPGGRSRIYTNMKKSDEKNTWLFFYWQKHSWKKFCINMHVIIKQTKNKEFHNINVKT